MKKIILSLLAVTVLGCDEPQKEFQMKVGSTNAIEVLFDIDEVGSFNYQVNKNSKTIIGKSKLGLIVNDTALVNNLEIIDQKNNWVNKTWQAAWGQNKNIVDKHQAVIYTLKDKNNGRSIDVEFRVFDDAVAYRYIFNNKKEIVLNDELSEIRVIGNPQVWYSNASFDSYESEYFSDNIDSVTWIATPVIMKRDDGVHIAINEANIIDYPDATLKNSGSALKVELVPYKSGEKAHLKIGSKSPWRVIGIGDSAKEIIGSNVLLNLADENKIGDASFCKPMTYVGIWWDYHLGTREWKEGARQGARTYEALRAIDFAFRNKIGGVVIEGWNSGWDKWGEVGAFDYVTPAKGYDLKKVADYAKTCGVRLIMHHETGADIEGYEAKMDSAFMLCKELGISDVKTGHAGRPSNGEFHHGQTMVKHFEKIAQTAAKYGLNLDIHEPVKGSGIERSYPNVMTREAVRGQEWEAWSVGNSPNHTVLIPFIRGLAGPTDYTPGIFDILFKRAHGRKAWNCDNETFKQTRVHSTLAHQLSLMLTIYSPWVMAADKIDNYNHPAFKFVSDLNPDYDESIVIDAQIGEYIIVARRSGDVWYIGATNSSQGRDISVPLEFLGNGKWNATVYKDGEKADWEKNPTDYKIENIEVKSNQKLDIKLANGGGAAVVLKKIN